MVKRYGGNLGHAWAAYNAGPGALDQAIKQADAQPGGDYLTFMPAETQAYVAKNIKAYNAGGGGFSTPTIADVNASIRTELGPNARPEVVRMALANGAQHFAEITAAKKAKDEEAEANIMRALVQNGGLYSQLSPSRRDSIRPEKVDDMMNFASRIAKGDDVTSPALFLKLTNNPELLGRMSDNAFYATRTELSASDFENFAKQRKDQMTGGTGKGWADLNTQAVKASMHSRLTALGIDPSPTDDGGSDAQRVGAIQMFVAGELREAQRQAGKQFNEGETSKFVDGLFAFNVGFKTTFLGMGTGSETQTMLSMKPSDVPSDTRAMLKKDFAARGIDATAADIYGAYMRMKRAQAKPSASLGGASGEY
jgi:soluble lytic murein transglycosylase